MGFVVWGGRQGIWFSCCSESTAFRSRLRPTVTQPQTSLSSSDILLKAFAAPKLKLRFRVWG